MTDDSKDDAVAAGQVGEGGDGPSAAPNLWEDTLDGGKWSAEGSRRYFPCLPPTFSTSPSSKFSSQLGLAAGGRIVVGKHKTLNTASTEDIQQYLESARVEIDRELDRLLPTADHFPPSIHQAMRYSVLAGGKRLRPILCLEAGRLMGGDERTLVRLGSALELIHTYSLIHDDLPALDNDDLRRGKPTSHRAFGESTAILAGDALLTLAFEVLASPGPPPEPCKLRVIHELAHAIGTDRGMIGGQVIDLQMAGQEGDSRMLEYLHSAKTGAFIRAAIRSGVLYAQGGEEDLARLTTYGEKVGLAFQIVDDLLDVLGTQESLGKTVGKDDQQHKATYPGIHGIEASQRMAFQLVEEACEVLEPYGDRAHTLQGIAQYLLVRQN